MVGDNHTQKMSYGLVHHPYFYLIGAYSDNFNQGTGTTSARNSCSSHGSADC
ncbi:MAG: hypothetical protein RLZ98_3744 [Pseudomonadota bacterium]|jgi:hypothetical protein